MEITTITKLINSIGPGFDILGAWFVAWEVVRQYQGKKYYPQITWNEVFAGPKETDEYKKYEKKKYTRMWIGLSFLTLGFSLQITSNWECLIEAVFL